MNNRVILVYGDNKTTSYIRNINQSQLESNDAWERKDWMMPVPAFFYIELNLLVCLFRNFWDTGSHRIKSTATISSDVAWFHRDYHIHRKNVKYHQALPAILHGFTARILAHLIDQVYSGHMDEGNAVAYDDVQGMMKDLTDAEIDEHIAAVWEKLFSLDAWTGDNARLDDVRSTWSSATTAVCCRAWRCC